MITAARTGRVQLAKHFTPAKPGTKLAGFEVMAEIGRGAASIIYLASDAKSKQVWALKHVLRRDEKDQRFIDQAASEYAIAQKVKNPRLRHIERMVKGRARLLQLKELFLVMEYVDGLSLELHPPETMRGAVDVLRQTAEGLAHMHKCGFVHADMKPNNIVVREDGSVKIIDLGQACAIGTVKERIQGTPDYIAPEQVHRRAITPQTDIYNLGATMYWVVTGKHIPTAMSGGRGEGSGTSGGSLLEGLDEDQVPKATPAREVNPGVPIDLSDLIDECVRPKMVERPDSMLDVATTLAEVLEDLDGDDSARMPKEREPDNEDLADTSDVVPSGRGDSSG